MSTFKPFAKTITYVQRDEMSVLKTWNWGMGNYDTDFGKFDFFSRVLAPGKTAKEIAGNYDKVLLKKVCFKIENVLLDNYFLYLKQKPPGVTQEAWEEKHAGMVDDLKKKFSGKKVLAAPNWYDVNIVFDEPSFDNPVEMYFSRNSFANRPPNLEYYSCEGIKKVKVVRGLKKYFRFYPRCTIPNDTTVFINAGTGVAITKVIKDMKPCKKFLNDAIYFGPVDRGGYPKASDKAIVHQSSVEFKVTMYTVWSFTMRKADLNI